VPSGVSLQDSERDVQFNRLLSEIVLPREVSLLEPTTGRTNRKEHRLRSYYLSLRVKHALQPHQGVPTRLQLE